MIVKPLRYGITIKNRQRQTNYNRKRLMERYETLSRKGWTDNNGVVLHIKEE